MCAFGCCDEVITPLDPEYFSINGIGIFKYELNRLNKGFGANIIHNKIVINKINRSFEIDKLLVKELKTLGYNSFEILQDSKLGNSQLKNMTIFEYYSDSKVIPEISRLGDVLCL